VAAGERKAHDIGVNTAGCTKDHNEDLVATVDRNSRFKRHEIPWTSIDLKQDYLSSYPLANDQSVNTQVLYADANTISLSHQFISL
jgi:hypothetical protein